MVYFPLILLIFKVRARLAWICPQYCLPQKGSCIEETKLCWVPSSVFAFFGKGVEICRWISFSWRRVNRDRGWFWGENSSFFNSFLFFESGNIPRTLIYKSMRLYFPGRVEYYIKNFIKEINLIISFIIFKICIVQIQNLLWTTIFIFLKNQRSITV